MIKILLSCYLFFILDFEFDFGHCFTYDSSMFSEVSLLDNGRQLWDSLTEKVSLPKYGTCWKNAISDLQVGCQFLSENVQRDVALRFTDCFLQMSGYDPMACTSAKEVCLKNLSDRAFNAYTEFYTHTQSLCYFLKSQVWHEEALKTIDKLTETSLLVKSQLEEAGQVQKTILNTQRESLILQRHLRDSGQVIASTLELSEKKILKIMTEFQDSAMEQKRALFELFEKLSLLHSWMIINTSWTNSVLFYLSSILVGYLFTSIPYTRQARFYILVVLTLNYFIERFIYTNLTHLMNEHNDEEYMQSLIWMSRKVFVLLSAIILIYSYMVYCDYNVANHMLLLEIKHLNMSILHKFEKGSFYLGTPSCTAQDGGKTSSCCKERNLVTDSNSKNSDCKNQKMTPLHTLNFKGLRKSQGSYLQKPIVIDEIDNAMVVDKKLEISKGNVRKSVPYNLRSSSFIK